MLEIRIHGRGGQGNVVAAYLLATAAIKQGRYAQAFPNFGAERRGAPVMAFVRIADEPIKRRCQVLEPDYLIIQDQALLKVSGVLDGLRSTGAVLVNSCETSASLTTDFNATVQSLAASQLAQTYLKRPVPNTALLAAFFTLTNVLSLDMLGAALADRFSGKLLDRNLELIQQASGQVQSGQWRNNHVASA